MISSTKIVTILIVIVWPKLWVSCVCSHSCAYRQRNPAARKVGSGCLMACIHCDSVYSVFCCYASLDKPLFCP